MRVPVPLPTLRAATALLLAGGLAVSQTSGNLIQNGDFEASKTSIAPWRITNAQQVINPRIVESDDLGYGSDNALAATFLGAGIEQTVRITRDLAGQLLMFGMAVRNGSKLTQWRVLLSVSGGTDFVVSCDHSALFSEFRLPEGHHTLQIFPPSGTAVQLDDIVLRPVVAPAMGLFSSCNATASRTVWWIKGRDERVAHVVFLALQRLDPGLAVPGFRGLLELDPFRDGGLVFVGAMVGDWQFDLPKRQLALLGRTVFAQAVAVNPILDVLQFGSRASWRERD